MDLDQLLRQKIRLLSRGPRKSKAKKTPEEIHRNNMRQIIRLVFTGDFDSSKRSHSILFNTAVKHGYIDKETHEILKHPKGGKKNG